MSKKQNETMMQQLTALAIGATAGAAFMYLFDPGMGGKRLASIKRQMNQMATRATDMTEEMTHQVKSRIATDSEQAIEELPQWNIPLPDSNQM